MMVLKASHPVSETDRKTILSSIRNIIDSGDYSEVIKKNNSGQLLELEDDKLGYILSEYYNDEDAEDFRDMAEEDDTEEGEDIASKLKTFISDIQVEVIFEDW